MNADERTCPECAETIKKAAAVCKHCGHRFRSASASDGPRNEAERQVAKNSKVGCAVVVVALVAFVSFCTPETSDTVAVSTSGSSKPGTTEKSFADEGDQSLWIVKSQDGIKARLRDPDSAEFKDSRFYSGGKTPVVCGRVNARDGFGGYTGFERYVASGEKLAFLESDLKTPQEMDKVWSTYCIKAPSDQAYVP